VTHCCFLKKNAAFTTWGNCDTTQLYQHTKSEEYLKPVYTRWLSCDVQHYTSTELRLICSESKKQML